MCSVFFKFKIVDLIEFFVLFVKKFCAFNLKNLWVDFHKIYNVGTSKTRDVQCKFMLKLDCQIVTYRHFKILVQACTG